MLRFSSCLALVTIIAASMVAGCASFNKTPPERLAGKRIDVTLRPDQLQPTPMANAEPMLLADPQPTPFWNQVGGSASHYVQHVDLPAKVVRAWSRSLGKGINNRQTLPPPVVHGGRLFAVDSQAKVSALETHSGKQLWRTQLPLKEEDMAARGGGLAVQGDLLFITTGAGQIFALTASSGKKVWDIDLSVPLRAPPTIEGETLYVVSTDNRLFALSALSGALVWTHSGMENPLGYMKSGAAAADNGAVVVPYTNGELIVLRASDGRFIWQDTLVTPYTGTDPQSTLTSIAATPVMADGLVYAVGLNGGLSAYGLTNGQRFWKANVITSQQPWVSGMHIFALTDRGELVALNRKDGGIRWVTDLNRGLDALGKTDSTNRQWLGPIFAGGRLMVASTDGMALSINPNDGERLAVTDLGSNLSVAPIAADGGVYFLTDDATIIAFRAPRRNTSLTTDTSSDNTAGTRFNRVLDALGLE